jgi:hypothetical protein
MPAAMVTSTSYLDFPDEEAFLMLHEGYYATKENAR